MAAAGEESGREFEDPDAVDCYRHRAPYPPALHDRLAQLATGRGRVLDLGCGPGKLAVALAARFERVDAVDPSAAMLDAGRRLAGRDAPVRWILAGAEQAPLDRPYDLAVAGASIHWMDHGVVMPRLAAALAEGAPLALVEGDGPARAEWQPDFQAVVVRWVERSGRTWNDDTHRSLITAHESWFDRLGEAVFEHEVRQPLADFIAAQHSRATWARARMGREQADAFDADIHAALSPFATADGDLQFTVAARLTWGRPRTSPRAPGQVAAP